MYLLSKPTKKGFCAQCEQHARSLDTACRELAKIRGWNHKHVQRIEALESALTSIREALGVGPEVEAGELPGIVRQVVDDGGRNLDFRLNAESWMAAAKEQWGVVEPDAVSFDDVWEEALRLKADNAGGTVEDNGTSQTVTVEAGARLMGKKDIKPRVHLHPYSTFQDIEQPRREFILRLNSEGQPGLFVADGEAWRNKAMADIKKWLGEKMPSMQIIA